MQRKNVTKQERKERNSKRKDSSAKMIFGDPVLCAQFLNGYVDIPMLKEVKPEDIEDVSNRYVHMFTEERNSDVVKKVCVKDERGEKTSFYMKKKWKRSRRGSVRPSTSFFNLPDQILAYFSHSTSSKSLGVAHYAYVF